MGWLFKNREDAAAKLRELIPHNRMKQESWNIVSVSSGGLVVASHLRQRHENSMDFLFSESIKAPNNKDCDIARVSEFEELVIDTSLVDSFGIKYDYIYGEARRRHEEKILSYIYKYRKGRPFKDMSKQIVLIVDEGSETGMKMLCAVKTILGMNPKAVYIATPIIPTEVVEVLSPLVDDIFFVSEIKDYKQTSCYYKVLDKVLDKEIISILGEKNEIRCSY
ncbi:MAG: phosphoribosyltransferase family protein [Campylobacterota bacterium]|nr:phosphoribosyltransferase family protein [Campylobacterota bacterium]